MAELELLTAENGVSEEMSVDALTEENISEEMKKEYENGKGDED